MSDTKGDTQQLSPLSPPQQQLVIGPPAAATAVNIIEPSSPTFPSDTSLTHQIGDNAPRQLSKGCVIWANVCCVLSVLLAVIFAGSGIFLIVIGSDMRNFNSGSSGIDPSLIGLGVACILVALIFVLGAFALKSESNLIRGVFVCLSIIPLILSIVAAALFPVMTPAIIFFILFIVCPSTVVGQQYIRK